MSEDLYDLTIIGGGPAGMYAAFYAGMRAMRVKLIEAKGELGGFLHHYGEKMIWDVGGVEPLRGESLIRAMAAQAQTFAPALVYNQVASGFELQADGSFVISTKCGKQHHTRTIVIAIGRGVTEMQKLPLQGADRYEVGNLHYIVQDVQQFSGQRVLISGGGNSAVDWAIALAEQGAEVTVVHRQRQFRAMERSVADMQRVAQVWTPYEIKRLHGSGTHIEQVELTAVGGQERRLCKVDAVVICHGYSSQDTTSVWGLPASDGQFIVNGQTESSIPGIFVAGDCAQYANKVRLIAGAFTDAILAVNSAMRYLQPHADSMAYVSSHNARFRERNQQLRRSR